jgi:hypothetical protein
MQRQCNVTSLMVPSFRRRKELSLQRNYPSFDGLSCWCKAIVTILSVQSLEQAVAGFLREAGAVLLNPPRSTSIQAMRMTIN